MEHRLGSILALASAALFGISLPAAKFLLGSVDPWLLAGLCYLGSGVGLACVRLFRSRTFWNEAPVGRNDAPWLLGAILSGGVVGPLLLFWGLSRIDASSASLLLVLEGVLTALVAGVFFHEHYHGRVVVGMGAITLGALVLSWPSGGIDYDPIGALAIVGACLAWAIDNNMTRKISAGDAVQIACIKGLVAGIVNLGLALARGSALPALGPLLASALVGFLGYGVSLVLFVRALRQIGTARTGAYYAVAPFFGTLLAIGLLGEPFTLQLAIAGALMGLGIYFHLAEQHEHAHSHEAMMHEHSHVHDEHHRHVHGQSDPLGEPHAHVHRHRAMIHSHRHFPDIHHRHPH